ncbi:hypothetical protein ACHQM5_013950 [Ranunculus cassubicifolius]
MTKQHQLGKPKNPKLEESADDIEDFSTGERDDIRHSLLRWYDDNQRVIPWRLTPLQQQKQQQQQQQQRAYAVWVSEMMLQQTRVATVIDYYNRWMDKWPTIHQLAKASQEEVNHVWAGLGYYRRARFLLEGAQMVVGSELGGHFPSTVSDLLKVPGIGQYTAGAIASIAFNQAVPVVDGNVIRVLARLKAISANPKTSTTIKTFWKLAGQLVDPCRPGDFNQALMELGATLCSPSSPSCSDCPVSGQCRAFSLSNTHKSVAVTDYPKRVPKTKQRLDYCAVCVVEIVDSQSPSSSNSVFLLVKRPEEGLLAGLWEFPSVLVSGEADLTLRRKAMDQYLKNSFNLDSKKKKNILSRDDIGEHVHVFSHIRLRMYVELLVLRLKGGANFLDDKKDSESSLTWKCLDGNSIKNAGLTSGVRKVYNMIDKFKQTHTDSTPSLKRKKM